LQGRVGRRAIERDQLAACRERMAVIATRLRGGQPVIHVLADAKPEPGFEPVQAGLEDVYFATLHGERSGAPAAAEPAHEQAH
jgi:hypothetical protein